MNVYDVVDLIWDLVDKGPDVIIIEGGPKWIDIEIEKATYRITIEAKP